MADEWQGRSVGNFRLTARIGAGGMGEVYRAENVNTGGAAAVKLLSRRAAEHANALHRFFSEARVVNHIRHPGIVSIYDLGALEDGTPYILMELLQGQPLAARIRAHGPLPPEEAITIGLAVLDALDAAHVAGVVHRDIKPDNVFLGEGGQVTVLDFGVAKLAPELLGGAKVTRTGAMIGTPRYMAPEQIEGGTVDARTDVYAVGLLLYEALAGRPAFFAAKLHELLRMQVEDHPMPLRAQRADVSAALEAVIASALAKDPAARHPSARVMAERLEQARGGRWTAAAEPTAALQSTAALPMVDPRTTPLPAPTALLPTLAGTQPMTRAAPAGPRRAGVWLALGGTALLVLGAGVLIGLMSSREPSPGRGPAAPEAKTQVSAAQPPTPEDFDEFVRVAHRTAEERWRPAVRLVRADFSMMTDVKDQSAFFQDVAASDDCVRVDGRPGEPLAMSPDTNCGDGGELPRCTSQRVIELARQLQQPGSVGPESITFVAESRLWSVDFPDRGRADIHENRCAPPPPR